MMKAHFPAQMLIAAGILGVFAGTAAAQDGPRNGIGRIRVGCVRFRFRLARFYDTG